MALKDKQLDMWLPPRDNDMSSHRDAIGKYVRRLTFFRHRSMYIVTHYT